MRSEQETTDVVRAWLEDGVTVLPDHVIDRVLDELPTTRQSRVWQAPVWSARVLVAAAVLMLAVVGAVSLGQRVGDASRSMTPAPVVRSLAPVPPGPLEAGPYVIDTGFPVRIAFDLPDGWSKVGLGADYAVITSHPDGVPERPPSGVVLGFYTVANVFADPCLVGGRTLDPPVGPTVEDLAAALADLPGYQASVATPASLDGHPGRRIELVPGLYMCEFDQARLWQTPSGSVRPLTGDQELITLWVLDVGGERLVVDATAYPETTDEDLDELMAVVDSIRIEPADEAR